MAKFYQPPFKMSDEIANLIIEIGEYAGRLSVCNEEAVIEEIGGSALKEKTHRPTLLDVGKIHCDSMEDMLEVCRVSGKEDAKRELFRSKGAGIYVGNRFIHTATPPQYVKRRMQELFTWMNRTTMHPLLKACIFYYEFVFIHPFEEQNDEMGQLWFLLILKEWHTFLEVFPLEELLSGRQEEYYQAVKFSKNGDSAVFVVFMLKMLRDVLKEVAEKNLVHDLNDKNVGINECENVGTKNGDNQKKVIALLEQNPQMTAKGLAGQIGLTDRQIERILAKLKREGRIQRIGASKNGYWEVR